MLVESLGAPETRWQHELGGEAPRTDIRLADGRRLRTGETAAILNRMLQPPLDSVAYAVSGDEGYARNELTAFAASWIRSLAPLVVNQPTPQGLSGRWRATWQWRALAVEAGLPVVPTTFASADPPPPGDQGGSSAEPCTTVLTVGGEPLVEGMPADIRDAARRFADLAETTLLGLRFAGATDGTGANAARHGWRLLDATPHPDLSAAGEAGIAALEEVLTP